MLPSDVDIPGMHISWHGLFTVKIQSQDTILVLDPHGSGSGLSPFRGKADVVALTNPGEAGMSHLEGIPKETPVINTPGEYSINGLTLTAVPWRAKDGNERSLHRWQIEGMSLLHVGAINRELTTEELEILSESNIDILLVPIGGGESLTTEQALQLITTIEPRLVIPINYATAKIKEKLATVEQFAKEMGASPDDLQAKLVVKKAKLPEDELQTAILSA